MVQQVEQVEQETNLSTSSKSGSGTQVPGAYLGLAASMAAELMIGF